MGRAERVKTKARAALFFALAAVAAFAAIFVCVFAFFGITEALFSRHEVDFARLLDDTLGFAFKVWIGAVIVLACRVCYDLRNKR